MSPARRRSGYPDVYEEDVASVSFARISRNISGYPFPHRNSASADAISSAVAEALEREIPRFSARRAGADVLCRKLLSAPPPEGTTVFMLPSESVMVAANATDHVAICGIAESPAKAYAAAEKVEDALGRHLAFAWRPDIGYLTASPGAVGTGLKVGTILHLEALHLIGELEPCMRGLEAMRMAAEGIDAAGIRHVAHVFRVANAVTLGETEETLVKRSAFAAESLVEQELNARIRLVDELPRVFADSLCRALAILKSARLLSPAETLDLLSPVRVAASMSFLSGITADEVDRMFTTLPVFEPEDPDADRRDAADGKRADQINRRFARVVPNNRFIELMP
jgi:protein arginine kinase